MARWRTGLLVAQPATAVQAGPEAPHGRTKGGICHRTGPWRFWQESVHRPAFAGALPGDAWDCCCPAPAASDVPSPLGASIARAAHGPSARRRVRQQSSSELPCRHGAWPYRPADPACARRPGAWCGRCSHGPVDGGGQPASARACMQQHHAFACWGGAGGIT